MTNFKTIRSISIRVLLFTGILAFGVVSCVPDTQTTPSSIEGTWTCKEVNGTQTTAYKVDIQFDAGSTTKCKIFNFFGQGTANYVTATLSQSTLTIPLQSINRHDVAGSGTIASGTKSISIKHTDDLYHDGTINNVTATYSR